MIPAGSTLRDVVVSESVQPDRTYGIDTVNGRVNGMIDGLEAVKQAVHKILQTERYAWLIYSADYGSELEGLQGADPALVRSELKRRVSEALLQVDRITGISNFSLTVTGDSALAQFTVETEYGDFAAEVTTNV